jgi:hypothetical protein
VKLDKQVQDFNSRILESEGSVNEWKPKPKKQSPNQVIKCKRNINATSSQNALVSSLSPDTVIINDSHKKCTGCCKPMYC